MPVLLGPADAPPAPILLQRPPQNQQAQSEALMGNRPAAGAAATAAQDFVVFNADTGRFGNGEFGEFRDGAVQLPESE
eukprot:6280617-Alexandrium_andersonii.AAC.1